jgi:hypothetical protein
MHQPFHPVLESDEQGAAGMGYQFDNVPVHQYFLTPMAESSMVLRCAAERAVLPQFLSLCIIVHSRTRFKAQVG